MSDFGKEPAWYETQNVAEIEEFDQDEFGNTWFNVKFTEDAATHMWLAKEKPEEHKKYYGHFTPTKSGKRLRFKRDKVPEDEPRPDNAKNPKKSDAFLRDVTSVPIDMIRALLPYFDVQTLNKDATQYRELMELAQKLTEDALNMVDKIRSGEKPDEVITDVPDKITLDDLED